MVFVHLLREPQDGRAAEVATVGNEDMAGLPVFLGAQTFSGQAFTLIPGEALRMPSAVFKEEVSREGSLHEVLHYSRGIITVVNRAGLEGAACECYAIIKREYDRLLPEASLPGAG